MIWIDFQACGTPYRVQVGAHCRNVLEMQGYLHIRRLLEGSALEPEHLETLYSAYDDVLASLDLPKVPRFIRNAVARKIVALGQNGDYDRAQLVARARLELGLERPQLR